MIIETTVSICVVSQTVRSRGRACGIHYVSDIICSTKKMSSVVVIARFLFVAIRNESSESSAQTLVFFFIMIFHLLPNGQGGEVLAAFCDEESSSPFNRSAQDMQATLGCNLKDLDANFVDCSFGSRASMFSDLLAYACTASQRNLARPWKSCCHSVGNMMFVTANLLLTFHEKNMYSFLFENLAY